MVGYPKNLNTWEDVQYVVANFPKEKWSEDLHCLICDECVTMWISDHKLADGEQGITDAKHKVVEMESLDKSIEKWQYVLVENENAKIFRMMNCKTASDRKRAIQTVKDLL